MIDTIIKKPNIFNLVRLICALIIGIEHIYALMSAPNIYGTKFDQKILIFFSNSALLIFFYLSGYLLIESAQIYNFRKYLLKRLLRIYPLFTFSLFVIAFVYYPILVELDGKTFSLRFIFEFLVKNIFLYPFDNALNSVIENNYRSNSWDASNYALFYEFLLYFALFFSRKFSSSKFLIIIYFLLTLLLINNFTDRYSSDKVDLILKFTFAFYSGAILRFYRYYKNIKYICIFSILIGIFIETNYLGFSYLIFLVLEKNKYRLPKISKLTLDHDFSYGIYLFTWPVIQFAIAVNILNQNNLNYCILAIIFIIELIVGLYLIEHKFTKILQKMLRV